MKKLITLILALGMILALCACGAGSTTEAPVPEAAEEPSEAINNEPVEEPDPEPHADVTEDAEIAETVGEAEENTAASGEASGGPSGSRGGNRGGMGGMTSNDEELQAVIDATADKFEQRVFDDPVTGVSLEYSLFIPEGYDGSTAYPMIMFIPDSTGSGRTAAQLVQQYYGAAVWASDEDQAKHPSFVLVPAFSETVVDDYWNTSEQIEAAVNLIRALQEEFFIDENRLYTTGQSMGCMTSLYLNSKYPDLFAASLFVSGQWDISMLEPLEDATFFYITAGGDQKASGGQTEVMAMLDTDGISYTYGTWNAQDSAEDQDAAVEALLAESLPINFIRFEAGSVFKEGQSGMEHMASFNYGYKLAAVRDWLFEQTK